MIQTLYVTIVKPFESKQMVAMEVVNEIKLYFVALLILISQSGSILEEATKEYKMTVLVGWMIFAVELIVIGINVVITIVSAVNDRKRDLKIKRRNKSDALRKAAKEADREKHR